MKVLHINGRRWFQKSYGNTYHSVQIWIDGEHVHSSEIHYGYGNQYEQTAIDWLKANDYLPAFDVMNTSLSIYCREHWINLVSQVTDVARERDL